MITITMMMKVMMMMMKIVSKGEPHSSLPHEPQALPFGHPGALQLLELNLFRWDPLPEFKAFKVFALFYILQFQTCHLTIASYGWTANDLIYLWKVKKRIFVKCYSNKNLKSNKFIHWCLLYVSPRWECSARTKLEYLLEKASL